MIHTCTIQKRSEGAASAANYGHGTVTWDDDYALGVACLLNVRRAGEGELVTQKAEGAPISYHTLFMEWRSDLTADGAAQTYRITTIKRADDTTFDAGPFNIQAVRDPAGQGHHLELALVRPPVTA